MKSPTKAFTKPRAAACFYPSESFDSLWRQKKLADDIMPPPNFGRFGMAKNRAKKLKALHAMMFSADETELDPNDDWRYARSKTESFNKRRELISPSWILVGDEFMSLWLGDVGIVPGVGSNYKPIPFLSFVPRKPDPLGAEGKCVADGETGCFLRVEMQEGAERHALQE